MAFYDLSPAERADLCRNIYEGLLNNLRAGSTAYFAQIFNDADTYIRKAGYLATGKIYKEHAALAHTILDTLGLLMDSPHHPIRQTTVNAAGEIGKYDFEQVRAFFDKGLFDTHHTVRNAAIGSVKKMGEKNPAPVLEWAKAYLHHPDKEIRREICHGIELRGRTHPEDILPLLKELEHDATARVKNTLVHVIGQISYKKGCLEKVITHLQQWENKTLAAKAIEEIIDVHYRYRNFSYYTQDEAISIINNLNAAKPAI